MSTQKVHFTLSEDALAIIAQRAPSPNKRGEWISQAIVDYDRILSGIDPIDTSLDTGLLEQIVNRLARMEKQTLVLLAKNL